MKRFFMLGLILTACTEMPASPDAGPTIPEIVDLIGAPAVLEDLNEDPDIVEVDLRAQVRTVELGGSMTYEMMTYNGSIPGPVLNAVAGNEVIVHFTNELAEPTTVHWHGLRIPDEMDGTPRVQDPIPPGGTFTYRFVVPEAGTFWYHPHVRANEQLEKGLSGPIVIRDALDPAYDAERMIVLDDILIDPASSVLPAFLASHPEVMHGRYGNVLLTNGRRSDLVPPGMADEGQVERWRIVNVANARTMELAIANAAFRVIGTDGGLLAEPYETANLTVPVGARYDVEVSYDQPGIVALQSRLVEGGTSPVYLVEVASTGMAPRIVDRILPEPRSPGTAVRDERITFSAVDDPTLGLRWQLNGLDAPIDPLFTFAQGDVVHITLENQAGPEHPFHLHGQWFEVVSGAGVRPGLYDTVLIPGLSTIEIIAYLDNPGRWMAHCHILEHAELGMMAEIVVE